jgi:hypothetical protein
VGQKKYNGLELDERTGACFVGHGFDRGAVGASFESLCHGFHPACRSGRHSPRNSLVGIDGVQTLAAYCGSSVDSCRKVG